MTLEVPMMSCPRYSSYTRSCILVLILSEQAAVMYCPSQGIPLLLLENAGPRRVAIGSPSHCADEARRIRMSEGRSRNGKKAREDRLLGYMVHM